MDIVERLRKDARDPALEAADEIERLREALKKIYDKKFLSVNNCKKMRRIAADALQQKEGGNEQVG